MFSAPKGHNSKAQGNALGQERQPDRQALKGRNRVCRPFRACVVPDDPHPGRCPGLSCLAPSGPSDIRRLKSYEKSDQTTVIIRTMLRLLVRDFDRTGRLLPQCLSHFVGELWGHDFIRAGWVVGGGGNRGFGADDILVYGGVGRTITFDVR